VVTESSEARPARKDLIRASTWLARLRADDCTAADQAAFHAWLRAAPAHTAAFEKATAAFEAAGAIGAWRPGAVPVAVQDEAEDVPVAASRRRFLLGAGATAAVGAGAIGWQAAFAGSLETGVGERRTERLEDGSTLLLDTDTRVRPDWLRARSVSLHRGRISVTARPDQGRPFAVAAGRHSVSAASMNADLRFENGEFSVMVVDGVVAVSRADGVPLMLKAGDRLSPGGTVDRPSIAVLTAWREGRLVFDNEPLAAACAELNRYDAVKLAPDPAVADLRISGTYRTGRSIGFANAVMEVLPVRAERDGDAIRLRAAPRGG
jgi:transmembrane sensor